MPSSQSASQHRRVLAQLARPAQTQGRAVRPTPQPSTRIFPPSSAPLAGDRVLQLQRTLGNRAVTRLVRGQGAQDAIQRAPMVYDFKTAGKVDAADWGIDEIDKWLKLYDKAEGFIRQDNNADFSALQKMRATPKIQAQLLQRDDPAQYAFDQAKTTAARDDDRIAAAGILIDAFENQDFAGPVIEFDKAVVVKELREVVADPGKMDQKGYPICGADTYLRMYAVHHPDAYVKFVVDVLTKGAGNLGKQRITVPKTVREKQLAVAKMRISEWVPQASLRIGSNSPGYNTIHQGRNDNFIKNWNAGIAGATTLKEMRKWFRAAGLPPAAIALDEYIFTRTPRSIVGVINHAFHAGHAVALTINPAIVGNTYNRSVARAVLFRHLVTLASDILPTGDSQNYITEVLTYGDKKRIVFRYDELSIAILGYLAADLAQFDPDQGQNGADADET